jgi:hypothetical protein
LRASGLIIVKRVLHILPPKPVLQRELFGF